MIYRCDFTLFVGTSKGRGRATRRLELPFPPYPGLVLDLSLPPHFPVRGSAVQTAVWRTATNSFGVALEPYLDHEDEDEVIDMLAELTGDADGWTFHPEKAPGSTTTP